MNRLFFGSLSPPVQASLQVQTTHCSQLPTRRLKMRRNALDYVCQSCRQLKQPRQPFGRRNVQISATPASTEQQQNLETPNAVTSSPSAGTLRSGTDYLESEANQRYQTRGSKSSAALSPSSPPQYPPLKTSTRAKERWWASMAKQKM